MYSMHARAHSRKDRCAHLHTHTWTQELQRVESKQHVLKEDLDVDKKDLHSALSHALSSAARSTQLSSTQLSHTPPPAVATAVGSVLSKAELAAPPMMSRRIKLMDDQIKELRAPRTEHAQDTHGVWRWKALKDSVAHSVAAPTTRAKDSHAEHVAQEDGDASLRDEGYLNV